MEFPFSLCLLVLFSQNHLTYQNLGHALKHCLNFVLLALLSFPKMFRSLRTSIFFQDLEVQASSSWTTFLLQIFLQANFLNTVINKKNLDIKNLRKFAYFRNILGKDTEERDIREQTLSVPWVEFRLECILFLGQSCFQKEDRNKG